MFFLVGEVAQIDSNHVACNDLIGRPKFCELNVPNVFNSLAKSCQIMSNPFTCASKTHLGALTQQFPP